MSIRVDFLIVLTMFFMSPQVKKKINSVKPSSEHPVITSSQIMSSLSTLVMINKPTILTEKQATKSTDVH